MSCKKQYKKQWRKNNPEHDKQYYQDHKEEYSERSEQYHQDHKEERNEYIKQWKKENRDKCNRTKQKYLAKIKNLPYDLTNTEWLFTKTLFEDKCAYCEKPIKGAIHHEHIIIPENGGGFTLGNIVPACESCNKSKHQKDVFVWMKGKGFNIQKFKDRLQIIEIIKSESRKNYERL